MNSKTFDSRVPTLIISSFLLLAASVYFFVFHLLSLEQIHDEIKGLILFVDLTIVLPSIYFLFVAKKGFAPRLLVFPLISAGLLTTINFVPEGTLISQLTSYYFVFGCIAISAVLSYFTYKLVLGVRRFNHVTGEQKIEVMMNFIVGNTRFSKILQTEILTFYYAICCWFKDEGQDNTGAFSYHKKSGHYGMVIGITVFHIPGIVFVHIMFANLAPQLLLALTLLHLYSFYFCIAFARALIHRPLRMENEHIQIRCGLLFNNAISIDDIASVETISLVASEEPVKTRLKATLFGHCNVLIKLKTTVELDIISGLSKKCDQVLLGVDEPGQFISTLRVRIQKNDI